MHGATCPKCGAAGADTSKTCSSCGAVCSLSFVHCPPPQTPLISLVSEGLTGVFLKYPRPAPPKQSRYGDGEAFAVMVGG